ncbi:hypothetical protein [Novosphingobium sp. 9U]|uniref:hypothetical protein n=1 Tax=Novosphingobium sp. 9U TaxID=2653158 RepID=UPI0012F2B85E|nr:hypothetical protein [Novosphingobium sp. 9U]VWX54820.1 conserved hypothetical protein [Novosphingobium sp. 9U]
MTSRRALVLFRLWAALLLFTISLQAVEPVVAPLQRVTGSAFSAATADVALASSRRSEAAKPPALPNTALPEPLSPQPLAPTVARLATPAHVLQPARGPPPRKRPERLPDLRGPPLA